MTPTPEQYRHALETVGNWSRAWIVTHTRPDGDAIGSLIGARYVLRKVGVQAAAITPDPLTPRYEFLASSDPLTVWKKTQTAEAGAIDGLVIVDTCARTQLLPFADLLESLRVPVVVFDHHESRDVEATVGVFDTDAAATSLMIAEWAFAAGIELDEPTSLALFAGLAADTGWFRFDNADVRAYETAARLIERGVDPHELYDRLYCSDRPGRIAILAGMLSTIELHVDGRLAVAHITRKMIQESRAEMGDLEELATEIGRIGSVVYWALLTESHDGLIRVSLRSKHTVNVARIAESLGGGGHARAAGVRIPGKLSDVQDRVLRRLLQENT